MKKDEPPERLPGRLARTLRTAWLGSAVGSRYLGGRIADAFREPGKRTDAEAKRHVDNARHAVETMRALKGPVMKIGQLLSTHTRVMPGSWSVELESLQEHAPPMSFRTIRSVVESELGASVGSLFSDLSEEAAFAASLGQVHRGVLPDGTEVAVKVQYPGAEASVEGDVKNIELAAMLTKKLLAGALGRERFDVTPMAEEVAEHLRQETDYCREAYNAKLVGELFRDDPHIIVPRVHDSHSGLRVITYDWLEGEEIDTGLTHRDEKIRERTVTQLVHAFWHQIFRGGLLHADPHPGNFRIMPDGRLGILDYGCVKIFSTEFVTLFAQMVVAQLHRDEDALIASMLALELIDDAEDAARLDDVRRIADYCSVGLGGEGAFDFSEYDYVQEGRALVGHFLSRGDPPPSQRDFLFLSRVLLGYYEYFSRAEACMPFSDMIRPYVEGGFTGRAIEVAPYD